MRNTTYNKTPQLEAIGAGTPSLPMPISQKTNFIIHLFVPFLTGSNQVTRTPTSRAYCLLEAGAIFPVLPASGKSIARVCQRVQVESKGSMFWAPTGHQTEYLKNYTWQRTLHPHSTQHHHHIMMFHLGNGRHRTLQL